MASIAGRQVISSLGWVGLSSALANCLAIANNLVLARLLQPDDYGLFATAASAAALVFLIASWGIPQVVIYLGLPKGELVGSGLVITVLLFAPCLALLLLLGQLRIGPFLEYQGIVGLVGLVLVARLLVSIADILCSPLEKELRYKDVVLWRTLAQITSIVVAISSGIILHNYWALVAREVVYGVTLVSVSLLAIPQFRSGIQVSRRAIGLLLSFGLRLWGTRSLEVLNQEGDAVVASLVSPGHFIGIYNRGRFLAELLSFVTTRMASQVAFSTYSALHREPDRRRRMFLISNYLLLHLGALFVLNMLFFGREAVLLLYGEGWSDVAIGLVLLAPYAVALPMFDHLRQFVTASGDPERVIVSRMLQFCAFAAVLFGGWSLVGWLSLPIAMSSGMIVAYAALLWQTRRWRLFPRRHLGFAAYSAVAGLLTGLLWQHVVLQDSVPKTVAVLSQMLVINLSFVACGIAVNRSKIMDAAHTCIVALSQSRLRTQTKARSDTSSWPNVGPRQ